MATESPQILLKAFLDYLFNLRAPQFYAAECRVSGAGTLIFKNDFDRGVLKDFSIFCKDKEKVEIEFLECLKGDNADFENAWLKSALIGKSFLNGVDEFYKKNNPPFLKNARDFSINFFKIKVFLVFYAQKNAFSREFKRAVSFHAGEFFRRLLWQKGGGNAQKVEFPLILSAVDSFY